MNENTPGGDAAIESDGAGSALDELKSLDHESYLLERVSAILSWDQETGMPDKAVGERAEQLSLMQGIAHERTTSPRIGELLDTIESENLASSETDRAFLREKRRQYEKATKLPTALVRELAQTASLGHNAWVEARAADEFGRFAPILGKLIELNRAVADHLGWEETPYDALLDQYEPYAKTAEVRETFATLRDGLVTLVREIGAAEQVDASFLSGEFPVAAQEAFSHEVATALGYDFERGLLDRSAHPFTTTLGSHDVRITTRYDAVYPASALFSTIHETGHALYELGIGEDIRGGVLAEGTSLGIHESQSRMWENIIGRSRAFWSHWLPRLKVHFPDALDEVDLERFYRAINRVEPSLIRVEADEVTYSLHVILRFELEQELIEGRLAVADLPAAWNERMEHFLGVVPPSDATGVLQDVHWSMGMFGYFPTYALGNLYAAQFYRVYERENPDAAAQVESGDTAPLLAWLRDRIHRFGRMKSATELVLDITGEPLNPTYFLEYLRGKYREVYRL